MPYPREGLMPTDVVPAFRGELRLLKRSDGGTDVHDPASGNVFSFAEHEISLARMLDGRRQVHEVLRARDRLGLPVTIETLSDFIDRLGAHGLLGPATSGTSQAWSAREPWEENTRTLFQNAVRSLRQRKYRESMRYFEAVLVEDPDNSEAKELLELAETEIEREAQAAQAKPAPPPPPQRTPSATVAQQRTWVLVAALAGVIVGGVLFGLILAHGRQPAPTPPRADADVTTHVMPTPPLDAAVAPADGAPDAPIEMPPPADAAVDAADTVPVPADAGTPTVAADEVTEVTAPASGTIKSFLTRPRTVKRGDKLFELVRVVEDPAKAKAAAAKVEEMKKLAKQDAMYEPFLADAKKQLAAARRKVVTAVVAPKAGKAKALVKSGAGVRVGQVLAEIQ
jgi:biotin carboxyl carrier protein